MIGFETKTILLTLTYLVGIGELILAIYFWVTRSGQEIRKVMGLLCFAIGAWALTNAGIGLPFNLESLLPYTSGIIILTALLHISLVFPFQVIRLDVWHRIALYVPTLIFIYAVLFTHTIVERSYFTPQNAGVTIGGELFWVFNFYLFALWFFSLIILQNKFRRYDGLHRRNIKIVFWSIFISGLPAMFFAVAHFMQELPYNYLYGPIASGIWLGAVLYIINKK